MYEGMQLISTSLSSALWEIPTTAVTWPATTKPWFATTLLVDPGTPDCHLQTFMAHTGMEFAAHLHASGGQPMHILCAVPYADGWDIRDIVSAYVGKIADTAVVVVRDADGVDYCPDAPGLSVSSVAELVPVASLIPRQRPSQPTSLVSLALIVHSRAGRKAASSPPVAQPPVPAAQADA